MPTRDPEEELSWKDRNELAARRHEERIEQLNQACREDAPGLMREVIQMELELEGKLDSAAGEFVSDFAVEDKKLVVTIGRPSDQDGG